jgi:hypothetical protein
MSILRALMEPVEGQAGPPPAQRQPQMQQMQMQHLQQQPHPHAGHFASPRGGAGGSDSSVSSSGSAMVRSDGTVSHSTAFSSWSPRAAAAAAAATALPPGGGGGYCGAPGATALACGPPLMTTISLPDVLPSHGQHHHAHHHHAAAFYAPQQHHQQHHHQQQHLLQPSLSYGGVSSISAPLPQQLMGGGGGGHYAAPQAPSPQAAAPGAYTVYASDWDSAFAAAQLPADGRQGAALAPLPHASMQLFAAPAGPAASLPLPLAPPAGAQQAGGLVMMPSLDGWGQQAALGGAGLWAGAPQHAP